MAEWTRDQIKELSKEAFAVFDDGFQVTDLFELVPILMKVVRDVTGTTGPEKKALAIMLGEYVIDETDTPWLPDPVMDPIFKRMLPGAIQMAWDFYAKKHDLGAPSS